MTTLHIPRKLTTRILEYLRAAGPRTTKQIWHELQARPETVATTLSYLSRRKLVNRGKCPHCGEPNVYVFAGMPDELGRVR